MTRVAVAVATAIGALAASWALASNPPWGGDDTGFLPTPKSALEKCETRIAKANAKLVSAIVKCHGSRITGKLASDAAEDTCESTAIGKFTGKTKTTGCAPCTNLGNIAAAIEVSADSAVGAVLCGSGTPMGGDDAGHIPSDSPKGPLTKCAVKVNKATGVLAGAIVKCHTLRAHGKITDEAGEETCENTAISKFTSKTKTTGCDGCVTLANVSSRTHSAVDSGNGLAYCQSPSSAFVEKRHGYLESLF
jgi:hypothetical protein